jgi:Carboxypeptidase regulatory-like domain
MHLGRVATVSIFCALSLLATAMRAQARAYHGIVTFGGLPVPGATVTAAQGARKFSTVTDLGGLYHFDDLPDGQWTIEVEMQCFQTIHTQVTIGASTQPGSWALALLPADQLIARTRVVKNSILPQAAGNEPAAQKKSAQTAEGEMPKAPESPNDQSADGYLVQGSVNNSATSRYSTNPAFGNSRSGGRGLYTGGFAAIFGNSATDARPYSISGAEAAKSAYDHITTAIYFGGPIRIPRLLPRGPNFFVNYEWTRSNKAAINTGLVPTAAERAGDFAGLMNAQGQPVALYNPFTHQPYQNNMIPQGAVPGDLSPQAVALLALYPSANPNIPASSGYNYQAPVLNSNHQDALQSRFDKTLGRRDQLYGGFNFQSTRADSVNLFGFVDTTDTLGLNGNIHWNHRFTGRLFLFTGYTFSRFRTQVRPNFANRLNISGNAGIGGNDQDSSNWGPPALSFSSGIAPLSDGNSAFNRSQTDGVSVSVGIYRGRHNISAGGDFHKQLYNDDFEQNPRGTFGFTGAATANGAVSTSSGSDLADFMAGVPDTSAIAFGNADKYLREPVYDAYFTDDWRILSVLTVNAGVRYEYSAPITELHGRIANLDLSSGFAAAAPVAGNDPVGSVTGAHYPRSLIRPDRRGIEPRIAFSWRPIPASTIVVRGSYGIYRDTSVYQSLILQMAQQAPFSTSFSVQNSAACPLTLASGFGCASTDTFAVDPNYRIGYAQTWQLSVQRDLPFAMQMVATYSGIRGTHGAQQFLPNTYPPIGADNPCPDCPIGFVYRTSGGNSTRQAARIQLRRRLKDGFTATLDYTYSKSIDDDAVLGGQGYVTTSMQNENAVSAPTASPSVAIAQNWRDLRAERARSTFDQRHLLDLTAQYTSGEGQHGGTLMSGWRGRLLKEWTLLGTLSAGTGFPETPIYPITVPGTGYITVVRPSLTGQSIENGSSTAHVNAAAFAAPAAGQWGTAGRDSITGPGQFTLDSAFARTFRPHGKTYLDLSVDATNLLNHPAFTSWDTTWNAASASNQQQFGRPIAAGGMRSLQTTIRLRF